MLTMVKRAKINYNQSNGTYLQGYKPEVGFLGRDNFQGGLAPGLGYVFGGSQVDILNNAIENNWLITEEDLDGDYVSRNYGRTKSTKLDYNISVKPLKDLTIDFVANRIKTSNINQQINVIRDPNTPSRFIQDPDILPFETGNYSTSYFMLGSMFTDADALFNTFQENRAIIAERLASPEQPLFGNEGFTSTSQQVLLPAFLAAYGGKNPNSVDTGIFKDIPIPNWTLRYNGLMKYKWFKKEFFCIYYISWL